jgi:hypothetical protein
MGRLSVERARTDRLVQEEVGVFPPFVNASIAWDKFDKMSSWSGIVILGVVQRKGWRV